MRQGVFWHIEIMLSQQIVLVISQFLSAEEARSYAHALSAYRKLITTISIGRKQAFKSQIASNGPIDFASFFFYMPAMNKNKQKRPSTSKKFAAIAVLGL